MRLFYALWPDECVRQQLADRQAQCLPGGVAPTHIDDLHLTLHFLGQANAEQVAQLVAIGERMPVPAFDMVLDRTGHFPKARALWLGPSVTPITLSEFHQSLRQEAQAMGLDSDEQPLIPHVTLARKVTTNRLEQPIPPLDWPVRTWGLIESRSGRRPLYRPMAMWSCFEN